MIQKQTIALIKTVFMSVMNIVPMNNPENLPIIPTKKPKLWEDNPKLSGLIEV